jgi:flagella basal body P-ring formation protein FlgA
MRSSSRLLVTLVLAAAGASAAPTRRVTVRPETTISGDTIRLGDIAMLEGADTDELAALSLGSAPAADESRTLDGAAVLEAVRRQAGGLDGITYTIPRTVRVRRAMQEVPERVVRAAVERFLADTFGAAAADAVIRDVELSAPLRVPAGSYETRIVPPPGVAPLGRVRLELEIVMDDHRVKSTWVSADIALNGYVVVARRPIARGEKLAAEDLTLDRCDLSRAGRGVVSELADATGLVAQVPLAPFAPIKREQLAAPAAVHRGDAVLLVAERGPLRITAAGEAREDAGIGQQVRVVNRMSRKDLIGHVVDGNTVAVDF